YEAQTNGHHDHRDQGLSHHGPQDTTLQHKAEGYHAEAQNEHHEPQRQTSQTQHDCRCIARKHDQFALREVDDARRLVDEHKPHAHGRVNEPYQEAVGHEVDEEFHAPLPYPATSASPTLRMTSLVSMVAWRPS